MEDLMIDPNRIQEGYLETGIYVRAKTVEGKWDSVDISALDKPSLIVWLKSRGGDNPWAENAVGLLLGHGHLYDQE